MTFSIPICQICNHKVEYLMECPLCHRHFGRECYDIYSGTCIECGNELAKQYNSKRTVKAVRGIISDWEHFDTLLTLALSFASFGVLVYLNGLNFPTLMFEFGFILIYLGIKKAFKAVLNTHKWFGTQSNSPKYHNSKTPTKSLLIFKKIFYYTTTGYVVCLFLILLVVNFWSALIAVFLCLIFAGAALSGGRARYSLGGDYYYTESTPSPPIAIAIFGICFLFFASMGLFSPIPIEFFVVAGFLSIITIYLALR